MSLLLGVLDGEEPSVADVVGVAEPDDERESVSLGDGDGVLVPETVADDVPVSVPVSDSVDVSVAEALGV